MFSESQKVSPGHLFSARFNSIQLTGVDWGSVCVCFGGGWAEHRWYERRRNKMEGGALSLEVGVVMNKDWGD